MFTCLGHRGRLLLVLFPRAINKKLDHPNRDTTAKKALPPLDLATTTSLSRTQPFIRTHRPLRVPRRRLQGAFIYTYLTMAWLLTAAISYSLDFPNVAKDSRSVSEPLTSKQPTKAVGPSNIAMEGPMVAAPAGAIKPVPRNSSLDTAISALSSRDSSVSLSSGSSAQSADIAHLIKTAGSPEAVIKYLLKEKQSQSQQNAQLWRLVDKQRAMILGLNKDLEATLKDKDRYRKKLKELVANPSVLRATTGRPPEGGTRESRPPPRVEVDAHRAAVLPDSPVLESDSPKASPVDLTMAPYPITPPADHPQLPASSGVAEVLDPTRFMPRHQEHAVNNYDHEAEERAEEQARNHNAKDALPEILYNGSLPPSRSLPSEPPKVPPPRLPPPQESAPQKGEPVTNSTTSMRKGPPAPLHLPNSRRQSSPPAGREDSDSESEYDNILNVKKGGQSDRGRRRVRDGEMKETDGAGNSKQNTVPEADHPSAPMPEIDEPVQTEGTHQGRGPEAATASLAAVLNNDRVTALAPSIMSPGLPLSPRPLKGRGLSPPGSPRIQMPLSPRPPRQPIPLPPNASLAVSSVAASIESRQATQDAPLNIPKIQTDSTERQSATDEESSPTERTEIYKGLATEEFPDLLLPPNALPSIDIRVASSRMRPSRASLLSLNQLEEDPVFTLAVISRADRGELWRVEKDISSLSKLDVRMKQCQTFTAKTPEKSLFSGHSPAKLDARRQALETYLDELLNTQLDDTTAVELCKYLSTNAVPPNADESSSVAKLVPDQAPNVGPEGRPIRSGYLTKKGKNFGGWKVRFFVLDGPSLKYYETPGGPHLGTIKLKGAQIGKQAQSGENQSPAPTSTGEEFDNQYRHAFLILEPKKKDSTSHVKHVLCAEDDRERDLWVDALLQWIAPLDGQPPKSVAHDRQHPESANSSKSKKPTQMRTSSNQVGEDPLIGVRYDSTNAGDAPQQGTSSHSRPKTGLGLSEQPSLQNLGIDAPAISGPIGPPKIISGPKDLHLISDASSWGNRLGPPQPSAEDKKQRKRSFFGFGPKTRSSSDGQESLAGSESGSAVTSQSQAHHVGQVFGASLAEAVQYHRPRDVDVPLPSVVYRCIQYLEANNALNEEGIFRLSGSNIVIKQIRERFNHESDINLISDEHYYDIHAVASLLKLYLRELPSTILTRDLHLDFLNTTEIPDRDEKVAAMAQLAERLPEANLTLLKYLISFLIRIINNSDVNKMTVRNVGIVFSPTLNIPAPVFATFLLNFEGVFGIDAEEYELPTPSTIRSEQRADSESVLRSEGPPRYEAPPRPSTSSGSASPHRQPRMDAVRVPSRSTPTPPLGSSRLPTRESPTPSFTTSHRPAYEPAHLAQQGSGGTGAPHRPGYEANHGFEQGGAAAGTRPPAAYERALYQLSNGSGSNLIPNEQRGNRRRESSIYMNGGTSGGGRVPY